MIPYLTYPLPLYYFNFGQEAPPTYLVSIALASWLLGGHWPLILAFDLVFLLTVFSCAYYSLVVYDIARSLFVQCVLE